MKKRPASGFCSGFCSVILLFALNHLVSAQSLLPAEARLQSGINLYSQGKWQEAIPELRRAQAESPSNQLRAEALFWISISELSAGQYDESLRDMNTLEQTDPGSSRIKELPYHRGRVLYYLNRYDEAILNFIGYINSLRPAPGATPNASDASRKVHALYWTGECLFSLGQLDTARDIFKYITEEYAGSTKYEASNYRLNLINQKKVEAELLGLLKWSHEESLRNIEESRRRESTYDQALSNYQKRIADLMDNTKVQDLENENDRYRSQLKSAEERIRSLENALRDSSASADSVR